MSVLPSVTEIIAGIKRKAEEAGCSEKELIRTYIKKLNAKNRSAFAATPFPERVLLLPQCLRQPGCIAPQDQDGYHCQQCNSDCQVNQLIQAAQSLGYKASFILPGGSMIPRILSLTKPRAVLGISCEEEGLLGILSLERQGFLAYSELLIRDGCYNTAVNLKSALLTLSLAENLEH